MKPTLYLYIRGIMKFGGMRTWSNKAVTATHIRSPGDPVKAENGKYWAGPFTRRVKQQMRAKKLYKMLLFYIEKDFDIILIGHSNGCDLILRILRLLKQSGIPCVIKAVHMLSPACDEDLNRNGMIEYLKTGFVGNLKLYIAGKDKAMILAKASNWFRFMGLGYGNLGGQDPEKLKQLIGNKNVIYEPRYGHSSWFCEKDGSFDKTMKKILSKT